jgi:hypothetical protein
MTLQQTYDAMHSFNRSAAPGSECSAWQDFVADCHSRLGYAPWADEHWDDEVPADFADYWSDVAAGRSGDYDPENGARLSDLGY